MNAIPTTSDRRRPPAEPGPVLPMPEDEPTITVTRTARVLGISRSSAYEAIGRGEIPAIRFGNRIVVPTAALRALLGLDPAGDTPAVVETVAS
jgi:excisionase family DNA binding protein